MDRDPTASPARSHSAKTTSNRLGAASVSTLLMAAVEAIASPDASSAPSGGIGGSVVALVIGAGVLAAFAIALVARTGRRMGGRRGEGFDRSGPVVGGAIDPWREAGRRQPIPDLDSDPSADSDTDSSTDSGGDSGGDSDAGEEDD